MERIEAYADTDTAEAADRLFVARRNALALAILRWRGYEVPRGAVIDPCKGSSRDAWRAVARTALVLAAALDEAGEAAPVARIVRVAAHRAREAAGVWAGIWAGVPTATAPCVGTERARCPDDAWVARTPGTPGRLPTRCPRCKAVAARERTARYEARRAAGVAA